MSDHDRNGRGFRAAGAALVVLFVASAAAAQSTAGFPPAPGAPAAPPPRSPPPPSAPVQYPPGYGPGPAPQYPPAYGPAPVPQYPPGYAPAPAPAPAPQAPPRYQPGYTPGAAPSQYPPGYGPPAYGAPYYPGDAPAQPPVPTNPLMDEQLRYRQVLGAFHRSDAGRSEGAAEAPRGFVRVVDRTRRHHDGLYLRLAGGLGFGHDAMRSDRPLPSPAQFTSGAVPLDGSGGGTAGVTEVAIGYTPTRGIGFALGVYTATIPGLRAHITDERTGSYRYRVSQLAIIGPVADWYFFEDAGFHAQASPGVATYVAGAAQPLDAGPQAQAHTAVGFGFMLGLGYEWWIADQWSMGFLGRVIYGAMSGSDERSVGWTHTAYAPAVLISATCN